MKRAILEQLLAARADRRSVVLVTALDSGSQALVFPDTKDSGGLAADVVGAAGEALAAGRSAMLDRSDAGRIFLHVFNPPLRLFIVGAVHIAQALAPMAAMLGYGVTVIDPRRAFASPQRFAELRVLDDWPDDALAGEDLDARSAVVTLTHDPKLDDPAIGVALRSEVFYLGCLGSSRTHGKRVARLQAEGFSAAQIARIHAPVGADIGSKSPAEIALSIMAQITERLRRPETRR